MARQTSRQSGYAISVRILLDPLIPAEYPPLGSPVVRPLAAADKPVAFCTGGVRRRLGPGVKTPLRRALPALVSSFGLMADP